MANQPVKKKYDYEKYFSNEIKGLLKYISTNLVNEIAFTSLNFDIFLLAGLESTDSMLYKAINAFLTSDSISDIHDKLYQIITTKLVPVRPNRTIEYAADLKKLFTLSSELMDELELDTITSDMVFAAFMRSASSRNQVKKMFIAEGINDETAVELTKKARETMSAISTLSDSQYNDFSNHYVSVNLGQTPDSSAILIYSMPIEGDDYKMEPEALDNAINAFLNGAAINANAEIKKVPVQNKSKLKVDYCTSLNANAERGQISEAIGREKEIMDIARVLGRKTNNNVILIGEPGVGKTTIVNALAKRIVDGSCPAFFTGCTIWSLDINQLVSGTQFRGQFESRINSLIKDLKQAKKSILFIDNIHNYTTEKYKTEFDLFGALTPLFDEEGVKVIVTTTKKGYHNSFEQSQETERKFQKIYIEEPTDKECEEIISGIIPEYEKYHGVKYATDSIDASIKLAKRYISERKLPSSAIDILDEAGSMKKIATAEPEMLAIKRNRIAELNKEKDELIRRDETGSVRDINYQIDGLWFDITNEKEKIKLQGPPSVDINDIYNAVSKHTGIPVSKLSTTEKQQLATITTKLRNVIVGQDEAIELVSRGIKRNKIGLVQGTKPILSCMFIGNTGCGKTLFAKTLAKEIFGDEKYLVRFDMSEYSDETAVNKLVGAGAGYVGYNEGGLLTEAVKNKKHCVLLIDEIEKAAEKVYNIFLQVLDEGFLTDNMGYKVDFKNTIIILTSNVGTKRAENEKTVGFDVDKSVSKRDIIEKELKNKFPPEFLNRLDEIVYFNSLSDDNLKEIVGLELNKLKTNLENIGYTLSWTDDVVNYVFNKMANEKDYGARPIGRIIRHEIENKITDIILSQDNIGGFCVSVEKEQLVFEQKQK